MEENKNTLPPEEDFFTEEPPLSQDVPGDMPELNLDQDLNPQEAFVAKETSEPVIQWSPEEITDTQEPAFSAEYAPPTDTDDMPVDDIIAAILENDLMPYGTDTTEETMKEKKEEPAVPAPETPAEPQTPPSHAPRKGRPKRKKGYGLFGLPHLAASLVWLAIIVMIGTSLGRMLWVCAADVLAFGRESKEVTVTITSRDTIDDIAEKLHDAQLIRYPEVFKLYAKLAVDEGDILPGTFQLNTLYDYHALVVQMGPRSSTRSVVEDLLIPEGLNCRQIFELLEQKNICTVRELEEYAANGEFSDFWFLEGVERGDRYCLEGFLFPDTYDFYEHSTPREALGKMLLGFQARIDQAETEAALSALNERLSNMMRSKGCSESYIAENQLSLRDLLIVASLIEEETASSKESPIIASVIFNRLTEDQMYERYLNIDAAIIYATGDANNIDTSIDHPYNTYKYAGLIPGPISNPGLDSIKAALYFEDTVYYYYVLNPETNMHQFSQTLQEHEAWVEKFRGMGQ